jgi:plastocyanin
MPKLVAFLVLALSALALVACGSSSDSKAGGGGSSSTLALEADPGNLLRYTKDKATVDAGDVTIEFNNPQGEYHDVAIETTTKFDVVGVTKTVTEGETSTTVNLKPGTYRYFCTVPHHREGGMEGTLTVK